MHPCSVFQGVRTLVWRGLSLGRLRGTSRNCLLSRFWIALTNSKVQLVQKTCPDCSAELTSAWAGSCTSCPCCTCCSCCTCCRFASQVRPDSHGACGGSIDIRPPVWRSHNSPNPCGKIGFQKRTMGEGNGEPSVQDAMPQTEMGLGPKNIGAQNGTLANGAKDHNLRPDSCFNFLAHT